jgi:hypothetical protein
VPSRFEMATGLQSCTPGCISCPLVGSSPRRRCPAREAKPASIPTTDTCPVPRRKSATIDIRLIGTVEDKVMPRTIFPYTTQDVSALARSLDRELEAVDRKLGHVRMLNVLARSAGYQNFQHFRAQFATRDRLHGPSAPPDPVDYLRVERVARHFDKPDASFAGRRRQATGRCACGAFGPGFRLDKRRASHRSTRSSTPTICSATTRCCAGRFAIMDCCHAPRTVESIDGSNAVQRRKQLR